MPTSPADASASRRELDAERASYAPAHVQRRARDTSAPFSASEHATLEAAVLFADISGFTPLSSKLAGCTRGSPAELRARAAPEPGWAAW
jgi:class 3 adenylate cyclase